MGQKEAMRQDKRRMPTDHPPRKLSHQATSIVYPHREYPAIPWKVDFPISVVEVRTKDKPTASFFLNNMVLGYKRGSAHTLPETDVFLLPVAHRDSKAFGFLWINHSAIGFCDVSAEDILHTTFLHLRSHNNTSFLHLASHYFLMAGLLHLTRVQLKNLELLGLQACLFPAEEEDTWRWSVAERRVLILLKCVANIRQNIESCTSR